MYGGELGNWIFHPHCFGRIQVAAAMVFHFIMASLAHIVLPMHNSKAVAKMLIS